MMTKRIFLLILLLTSFRIGFTQTITIGKQIWMTKNLDVTKFKNGDIIPEAKTDAEWKQAFQSKQPVWCYYKFDSNNGKVYGKLYNYFAVLDLRGLCPEGYHIPTKTEWIELAESVGGIDQAGKKLRSKDLWIPGSEKCTNCASWSIDYREKVPCHTCKDTRFVSSKNSNIFGFSALPGGIKLDFGSWYIGEQCWFWSSKGPVDYFVSTCQIHYNTDKLFLPPSNEEYGLYIRCIKDSEEYKKAEIAKKKELERQLTAEGQVKPKIDSLFQLFKFKEARILIKDQKFETSKEWYFNNKIDSAFLNYLNILIDENEFKKFDELINAEKIEKVQHTLNQELMSNLISKRNIKENVVLYENLIAPIKNKPLSIEEKILVGEWDFKSKNLTYGENGKIYFKEVVRFNEDRSFYFLIKQYFTLDNQSDWLQEKTGYWTYENKILTLYIDYETTRNSKVRVNKTENIVFVSLSEKEAEKSFDVYQIKFNLKGKKRI